MQARDGAVGWAVRASYSCGSALSARSSWVVHAGTYMYTSDVLGYGLRSDAPRHPFIGDSRHVRYISMASYINNS